MDTLSYVQDLYKQKASDYKSTHAKHPHKQVEIEKLLKTMGSLDGKTIIDLGCGSGHHANIFAGLVKENGEVTGVDFSEEQIKLAKASHET